MKKSSKRTAETLAPKPRVEEPLEHATGSPSIENQRAKRRKITASKTAAVIEETIKPEIKLKKTRLPVNKKSSSSGAFLVESVTDRKPAANNSNANETFESENQQVDDDNNWVADFIHTDESADDGAESDEEGECDDSSCDCHSFYNGSGDDDISVGSDAEEIVSNSDEDISDWSVSDCSSDDSCPQLIPIGAELPDSDTESSGEWLDVSSAESASEYSSDESCPQLIPIGAELPDSDSASESSGDEEWLADSDSAESTSSTYSEDGWEEEFQDAFGAVDADGYDCEPLEDDGDFETAREPLVITIARGSTAAWADMPLDVHADACAAEESGTLDTTIQTIVSCAVRKQNVRFAKGDRCDLNDSFVNFVDRLKW